MLSDAFCIFGLPVAPLTMAEAKRFIRQQAPLKQQLVLSTININWVVQSFSDQAFRAAILNSDLVTLDGKPLVWLARLIGCPVKNTVPGSTLMQELRDEKTDKPLTIYLFGGDGDASESAMQRINQDPVGLHAVGAMNPGYGSVEEMSTPAIIDAINHTNPDILLVALGARKGTAWIEKNRHKLKAGIISHLGATVNFLAGTVKRAPRFMQSFGLEWVWRIYQEPMLFSRYLGDGLKLGHQILIRIPLWLLYRSWDRRYRDAPGDCAGQWHENEKGVTITLGSCLRALPDSALSEQLLRALQVDKDISLDFQATEHVDGRFLGLLLVINSGVLKNGHRLRLIHVNTKIKKIFSLFCLQLSQSGGID